MDHTKRNFWGWGYDDYQVSPKRIEQYKSMLTAMLGITNYSDINAPQLSDLQLREPRFGLSQELLPFCSDRTSDRASHSYGKSYRDIWRGVHGLFNNPPDYVAYPRDEADIERLFKFSAQVGVSLIPYGGGSSVVGGIEPTLDSKYQGVVSVDMRHFDKVLEVNKESRSARIQAGIFGPALEQVLKPHGLTLRHFPQSFEFSTLGGWIATRSGGHFATLYTHIDEFVQSVRMVTPTGIMQSRRLPGSGAGPSEERLIAGSEGIFGIITEAWMRLQEIPTYKSAQTVHFSKWDDAIAASRQISQSGLNPSNARLVDPMEAMSNGLGDGAHTVVILGFESHNHSVEPLMDEAISICEKHNGIYTKKQKSDGRDASADQWKNSFLEAPYLRDEFIKMGCIMETFETAVTWDQFESFHNGVIKSAQSAIKDICGSGFITCRFTHIYPDGPAPYYTIIAKGQTGKEIEQWDQIKKIVSDQLIALGGTITHHHAVGKDHQAHYAQQQSDIFARSLSAIKSELDPQWLLNPDVLIVKK